MKKFKITNANGRKFSARIVKNGNRYGRKNCHVNNDTPMVEFYDMSVKPELFKNGRFISSYLVSTLTENDGSSGLNLNVSNPDWSIDGQEMTKVVKWLNLI